MSLAAVPFIDLLRYEPGLLEELLPRIEEALRKGFFVGGPWVEETRQALKEYSGAANAVLCANGTDAIQLALRAANVGAGDTVLIPDMTFWATFEAVVNVGASPITIDVDAKTLHLSLKSIEEAIQKFRPKALILVHLYGWAAPETLEIRKLCAHKKIILIEDAAQALGVKIQGQSLLKEAPIATTSFYPAKVLGASGDAGAVFAQDPEIAARVDKLCNHGRTSHYEHGMVGWNSRVGVYESLFLKASLKHLDQRLKSRREVVQKYREELKGLPFALQSPAAGIEENGYLSVAILEPQIRAALIERLKAKKIGYGTVYPGAMSRQPGSQGFLKDKIDHGNADLIARSVLNLPCFAYMRSDEVGYVVEAVKEFFAK